MATPNLSEIVTTTLSHRSRKIADNVTENNALLSKLQMKGRARPIAGGRDIVKELSHAENQTYKRYSGYEHLNIAPSETLSAAVYSWKQAAVAVTISGLEQIQNSGREQMIDLLDARIEVAESTFKNNLSNDVYSDGTASSGKQVTGLQAQVSTSPATGTVGGIPAANYAFWRNQVQPSSSGTTTLTDANMEGADAGAVAEVLPQQRQARPDHRRQRVVWAFLGEHDGAPAVHRLNRKDGEDRVGVHNVQHGGSRAGRWNRGKFSSAPHVLPQH